MVLLGLADDRLALIPRLAGCFQDSRNPLFTVHSVEALVGQRLLALALGREDLVDHDRSRHNPAIGAVLGKTEPARSDCAPLAGKSTLNRLELSAAGGDASKHRKIVADFYGMDQLLVDLFLESRPEPAEMVLDLDSTDIPLHGDQEAEFDHSYYQEYCYMPLLVFCGRWPLFARLRSAGKDGAAGVEKVLARLVVARIREHWPSTHIILRTDSGFCREAILVWCESVGIDYVIGLARNRRLQERTAPAMRRSRSLAVASGRPSRRFRSFWRRTRKTGRVGARWSPRPEGRRSKDNPRFRVTLPAGFHPSRPEALRGLLLCAGRCGTQHSEHVRDQIEGLPDPVSGGKLDQRGAGDSASGTAVDVVDVGADAQLGLAQMAETALLVAVRDFTLEHHGKSSSISQSTMSNCLSRRLACRGRVSPLRGRPRLRFCFGAFAGSEPVSPAPRSQSSPARCVQPGALPEYGPPAPHAAVPAANRPQTPQTPVKTSLRSAPPARTDSHKVAVTCCQPRAARSDPAWSTGRIPPSPETHAPVQHELSLAGQDPRSARSASQTVPTRRHR